MWREKERSKKENEQKTFANENIKQMEAELNYF
jgi:hypothetical protein